LSESEKVLKLQNGNLAALLVLAGARLAKGELDKSQAIYKAIQTAQPNNESAAFNLGSIYRLQKKYSQAIEEFEKVLKRNPEHIDALIGIARSEVLRGNSNAALERVKTQLTMTKRQAPVYELLGQLQLAAKTYPAAIASLEKAISLEPERTSAYYLLGGAYAEQKQFDAAIEQYQALIKKSPNLVPPHMMAAVIYELKKDREKANQHYQKALDINKRFAPAANNLAWNFAEHGGNLDVALGLAQRAREASPNDAVVADTLGWIYYKKGAYGSAISLLKESNEKFMRKNPSVLYHLGLAYQKNREKDLAKQAFTQALNLGQDFPEMAETKQALAALN
jgi:tetratricopeptide (TPR) repeat protein